MYVYIYKQTDTHTNYRKHAYLLLLRFSLAKVKPSAHTLAMHFVHTFNALCT